MGHNEVKVIKKLEEAPDQISILNLVLAFEDHRRLLVKVLEEAHLPKIDTKKFGFDS